MPDTKQGSAAAAPAAATPETLAAVLAEMRDLADHRAADAGGERPGIELLCSYADRIDAAAEREREAAQSARDTRDAMDYAATAERAAFVGVDLAKDKPTHTCVEIALVNAAALREALEKIRHEYGWGRIGCRTCVSSEADVGRVSDLFEKQIDAALAAPARNCDRFATADDARRAFESAHSHGIVHNLYTAAFDWLFATAEGGDHA